MQIPDRLRKIGEPKHAVLAGFIHGCSPDPATRTMATTALVFSLWQLAGRRMSPRPPSMILLNAGEAAPDPIDALVGSLVDDGERNEPRMHLEAEFMGGSVELPPRAMANALRKRQSLPSNPTPGNLLQIEALEERYRTAQRAGFGYGHSRPYSQGLA